MHLLHQTQARPRLFDRSKQIVLIFFTFVLFSGMHGMPEALNPAFGAPGSTPFVEETPQNMNVHHSGPRWL